MRKILFTLMIIALFACPAMAQRYRQHQIAIVDEFGDPVTSITSITIFDSGEVTSPTLYADRAGTVIVANPITTGSANSTFDQGTGFVRWFQRAPDYKVTITDGARYLTVDSRNETDTRFPWFENYIGAAGTLHVLDIQTLKVGDDGDALLSWVNADSILRWLPDSDGVEFDIGSTAVDKQFIFHVYVGGVAGGGLTIDATVPSFTWTGGTAVISGAPVSINTDSAANITNIGTGTTTGAINIGGTASGIVTIDGASTGLFSIDGDLTLASTAGSVNIQAAEAATDAVNIDLAGANGGFDLDTADGPIALTTAGAAYGDMTLTVSDKFILISTDTAAAGIDIEANGGAAETVHLHANQGTSQASIELVSDVGGITSTASAVPDGAYGHKLSGSMSTATKSEGLGAYVEGNTSGHADGKVFALGSWLNITNGTPTDVPDSIMAAADFGIYAASAPTLTATQLHVINLEYQVNSGVGTPQSTSMMHFNCDDAQDVPDYWFTTGNIAAVNYSVNTGTTSCSVTTKAGAIKVYIGAQGVRYIWLYTDAGT